MTNRLGDMIDQGQGKAPADIVLKGGKLFDLTTGDLREGDIAICGDRIVGTLETYSGIEEIDISGRIVVPGFIDTHLHIESSLVTRTSSTAASCRAVSPPQSAIRTRSPMSSAPPASAIFSTARNRRSWT
jgi:adenine deaminase